MVNIYMKPYCRRKTSEEKKQILKEAEEIGIPAVAKKYNLNPITIRKWKRPEHYKKYNERNRERNKRSYKKFIEKNPDYGRLAWNKWRRNNLEKCRQLSRESVKRQYRKRKSEIDVLRRKRNKIRYREDTQYRITCCLRSRLRCALKGKNKVATTLELLGCSMQMFRVYLEKLFQEGMSWENYGKWEIDHIKPCSSFDLTKAADQRKCFHYTNCQPLWKVDNRKKSNHEHI